MDRNLISCVYQCIWDVVSCHQMYTNAYQLLYHSHFVVLVWTMSHVEVGKKVSPDFPTHEYLWINNCKNISPFPRIFMEKIIAKKWDILPYPRNICEK